VPFLPVTPMRAFPVIRDLVTDVSFNYQKARQIPAFAPPPDLAPGEYRMQQVDVERSQEFRKVHRMLPVPGTGGRPQVRPAGVVGQQAVPARQGLISALRPARRTPRAPKYTSRVRHADSRARTRTTPTDVT